MRKLIASICLSAGVLLAACGSNGSDEDSTDEEFCSGLFEEGPSPAGWDKSKVMKDCTEALDFGFTRDDVVSTYEGMD